MFSQENLIFRETVHCDSFPGSHTPFPQSALVGVPRKPPRHPIAAALINYPVLNAYGVTLYADGMARPHTPRTHVVAPPVSPGWACGVTGHPSRLAHLRHPLSPQGESPATGSCSKAGPADPPASSHSQCLGGAQGLEGGGSRPGKSTKTQ